MPPPSTATVTFTLHGGILNGDAKNNTLILTAGQSLHDVKIDGKFQHSLKTRSFVFSFEHNGVKYEKDTPITSDISLSVIWHDTCTAGTTKKPKDRGALDALLKNATKNTPSPNLNHIDTSAITDMSDLFTNHYTFNV